MRIAQGHGPEGGLPLRARGEHDAARPCACSLDVAVTSGDAIRRRWSAAGTLPVPSVREGILRQLEKREGSAARRPPDAAGSAPPGAPMTASRARRESCAATGVKGRPDRRCASGRWRPPCGGDRNRANAGRSPRRGRGPLRRSRRTLGPTRRRQHQRVELPGARSAKPAGRVAASLPGAAARRSAAHLVKLLPGAGRRLLRGNAGRRDHRAAGPAHGARHGPPDRGSIRGQPAGDRHRTRRPRSRGGRPRQATDRLDRRPLRGARRRVPGGLGRRSCRLVPPGS